MHDDETPAIPSDITTLHRTPTELTDDGSLRAIEIKGDKHTMVLAYHRDGGLAVLGGVTMREVQRPSVGEVGARKMVEIFRTIESLDVRGVDDANAAAIDRLHAAVLEYREFVENTRPDLPHLHRWIERQREALTKISREAVAALGLQDEGPHEDAALEHASRVVGALKVWQAGATALLQQGVLTAGGKPALTAPGALREIITSGDPLPFWSGLRETLAELRARAEAGDRKAGASAALVQENELARLRVADLMHAPATATVGKSLSELLADLAEMHRDDAGAAAQVREIRTILEDFLGRTPDPARSTVQVAKDAVAAARAHGGGDDAVLRDQLESQLGKITDLEHDLAELRRVIGADDSIAPGDQLLDFAAAAVDAAKAREEAAFRRGMGVGSDAELNQRAAEATLGRGSLADITTAVKHALGSQNVSRVTTPGGSIVRLILVADVPEDDVAAAETLVQPLAPIGVRLVVEREPGKPPEGYKVGSQQADDGEPPSSPHASDGALPSTEWGWWVSAADSLASAEDEHAGGPFTTEAAAIDDAWNAYVEGSQAQDKADA